MFRIFSHNNTIQHQEPDHLTANLQKLYENNELTKEFESVINKIHQNAISQERFRQLKLYSFSALTISSLCAVYAKLNLRHITSGCSNLERSYAARMREVRSIAGSEAGLSEFMERAFHRKREQLQCDNDYESIKFYSEVVMYISFAIVFCLLVKEMLSAFSRHNLNGNLQRLPDYISLYKRVENTIFSISDKFDKLSEDEKHSLTNFIEQDATQKIYLQYVCPCKQDFIVHPIEIFIKESNKPERSEIYDAYAFLAYLKTRASTLEQGNSLLTPTGSPISRYSFSEKINKEHKKYWVSLENKVNELSSDEKNILKPK